MTPANSVALTGSGEGRLTAAIGLAAFLFFALLGHGHFTSSDEVGVFAMTRAIVERGSLDVGPIRHTEKGVGGKRFSYFAPGQSVLAIPFYGMGRAADAMLPDSWSEALRGQKRKVGRHVFAGDLEITFACLYSPTMAAALVALFFRFQRRLGASPKAALIASALLAATTQLAILSTHFLRHTTEAFTILGALYFIHRWRSSQRTRDLALGCGLASVTLLIRVPAGLAALPLAGYLAWLLFGPERRRHTSQSPLQSPSLGPQLVAILAPLAVALLLHCLVNQIKWGTFLTSPMLGQNHRFDTPLATGLSGLLFSPGSSVFLYSPVLLLVPLAYPRFWHRHREEAAFALSIALVFLFVYAKFDGWSGLWSAPGPRYFFVAVPVLLLSLGPWLDTLTKPVSKAGVAGLAACGLWVQIVSTTVRWGAVPGLAKYPFAEPDQSGVLFEFDQSPVFVMSRLLFQGGPLDPWLLQLWNGWPGFPGRPGVAVALALLWAVIFVGTLGVIRRELRSSRSARS